MAKNTICLWYDKDAEAAARFCAQTFPDSAVGAVHRAPSDYPSGKQGDVLTVECRDMTMPSAQISIEAPTSVISAERLLACASRENRR